MIVYIIDSLFPRVRQNKVYFIRKVNKYLLPFVNGLSSNTVQYSFLEKPMNRGAWQATVCMVT